MVNARAALHTVHHSPVCQRARRVRQVEGVEQASAAQRIVQRGGVTVCLAIKVPAYYGGPGPQELVEAVYGPQNSLLLSEAVVRA